MNINHRINNQQTVAPAVIHAPAVHVSRNITTSRHNVARTAATTQTQSTPPSQGDQYASSVRDRLNQTSPKVAQRFDHDYKAALQKSPGLIDDAAKIKTVDKVLDNMASSGDISQAHCAELKKLSPIASQNGDAAPSANSTNADPSANGAIGSANGASQATDASSAGQESGATNAVTAHKAAPHVSGGGESSGPQPPNPTFLWKPASDGGVSPGNLVMLLPAELVGQVEGVEVLSPDGKTVLSKGKFGGTGPDSREHFRFDKPGASFPPGSIVRIKLSNGTTKEIKVPDTANRMEAKIK